MRTRSEPSGTTAASRDPARILWTITGAAWLLLVALEFIPHGHLAHAAHAVAGLDAEAAAAWLLLLTFAGGWVVMVTAMMLPTTVPMARLFVAVSAQRPNPAAARQAFFGVYFLVWLGFAGFALVAALALREVTDVLRPDLVLAGALALAGAFQFTALKYRCLTACREPTGFLYAHYRRGASGAARLGLRHALSCLGCCWALMLVMFATGVADLAWMLALTAIMVAEKTTRFGHRLVVPVGILLLVAAAVLALGGFGWLWTDGHAHH